MSLFSMFPCLVGHRCFLPLVSLFLALLTCCPVDGKPTTDLMVTSTVSIDGQNSSSEQLFSTSTALPVTFSRNVSNEETSSIHELHPSFLLMATVNSIRFWSPTCPPFTSAPLFTYGRKSSLKHGISGLALWRPRDRPVQLLWFDAAGNSFHRAAITRQVNSTSCATLLAIQDYHRLSSPSNPYFGKHSNLANESHVKLAIDERRHFLLASNFNGNRIDVYLLAESTLTHNELTWLSGLTAVRPYDLAVDTVNGVLFWIEDKTRLCHLAYHNIWTTPEPVPPNLDALKVCSTPSSTDSLQALAVNGATQRLVWAASKGRLYSHTYDPTGRMDTSKTVLIEHTLELGTVSKVAFFGSGSLILTDASDLHQVNLSTGHTGILAIEANLLFDVAILENLPLHDNYPVTRTSDTAKSTTLSPTPSPTSQTVPSTTLAHLPASSPTFPYPHLPHPSHTPTFLSTFLPAVLLLLFILLIILVFLIVHYRSLCCLSWPCSLGGAYAQLRKERANSTGRDMLIEEEDHHHHQPDTLPVVTAASPVAVSVGRQYRSNLLRQSSGGLEDIEDILGGPFTTSATQQAHPPRPCIACRESDMCVDKGMCMATYRVF